MAVPSLIDVVTPFDPSGFAAISGAQLQQFGSGIIPYSDKGFIIVTDDVAGVPTVPNANATTKWKTYMWFRRSATAISAYLWNPAAVADATYLRWVSINIAAIGVGSIQGFMISDNTIADIKIISLDWSKLTGVPAGFLPSGAAGGDLTGTYPNPAVANAVITGAKIAATTITHTNLAVSAVEVPTDIKPSAVGLSLIRTNVGATANEYFVPQQITTLINPAAIGDVGKNVVVANPYTDGFVLQPRPFISPLQAIAAAAVYNAAHGLGVEPTLIQCYAECISAELNYGVGDRVAVSYVTDSAGNLPRISFGYNATNVWIVQDSTIILLAICNKTTGIWTAITSAKWNLRVIASI